MSGDPFPGPYQSQGGQPRQRMKGGQRPHWQRISAGEVQTLIGLGILAIGAPLYYVGRKHREERENGLPNAQDKPGLLGGPGAPPPRAPLAPLAPLAPFMPTVAPWSSTRTLLIVLISIALLILLVSCGVGGFFCYRSADKKKEPQGAGGGGGKAEASTSNTTSSTNTSTAK